MNKRLSEHRQNKPFREIERKWLKAKGRYSKQYYCVEWIDLAHAEHKKYGMNYIDYNQRIIP